MPADFLVDPHKVRVTHLTFPCCLLESRFYEPLCASSALVVVNDVHSFLVTQVLPQAIRGKYEETVARLKAAGDDGRVGAHYRPAERLGDPELGLDLVRVELGVLQVGIAQRARHLYDALDPPDPVLERDDLRVVGVLGEQLLPDGLHVGIVLAGELLGAVLGRKPARGGQVVAEQLSSEHNANMEPVRQELLAEHPDDPQIVALKHGVWRVKGIIQVSRSLGDAYLKDAKFNTDQIKPKFRVAEPFSRPIMSADPSIVSRTLQPTDCFVILASDGLWEHLSNQEAVEIVHSNPRAGSAKRLIKAALQEAARKREMRYSDLMRIDKKVRRHFHDDITVIVLFFNHDLLAKGNAPVQPLSIRCPLDN